MGEVRDPASDAGFETKFGEIDEAPDEVLGKKGRGEFRIAGLLECGKNLESVIWNLQSEEEESMECTDDRPNPSSGRCGGNTCGGRRS